MQNRVSLIVAFSVLAVVSCVLGTVLTPNSSIGGEKEPSIYKPVFIVQPQDRELNSGAKVQETIEEKKEEKAEPVEQEEEKAEPVEKEAEKPGIDTDIDTSDKSLVAIEPDMHEFMEYFLQPSFKRLKPAMESEPVDNAGWKAIKAEALTLAEAGNLILMREPEEDAAIWNLHSLKVRGHGRVLYQAARAKDFKLASQHYRMMLISCNACHYKFAAGEHILTP